MSLAEKLKRNSTIKHTELLADSKIFEEKDPIRTPIPMLNVALSGELDGGFLPGLTLICGHSKHFKTLFALLLGKAFLTKYPDGAILFYTNEFGSPDDYFESLKIPIKNVTVTPFTDIEELKHDIVVQFKELDIKEKLMVIIDSVGMAASIKEIEDAENGDVTTDMTRAKAIASFSRIITPYLYLKEIPLVAVNHIYMTLEKYSKAVVSGGNKIYLAADTIWIVGRQQDKDEKDKELNGFDFIINVEKSRHIKEKSKIPISVSFNKGIARWSGMFDVAFEGKYIVSPSKGWYAVVNRETGEVSFEKKFRRSDVENDGKFWLNMLETTDLRDYIRNKYKLATIELIQDEE